MAARGAGTATAAGDRVPQQRICQRIGDRGADRLQKGGLSQKGFVPGQNVIIETRHAEGHYEMLAPLADDLGASSSPTRVPS